MRGGSGPGVGAAEKAELGGDLPHCGLLRGPHLPVGGGDRLQEPVHARALAGPEEGPEMAAGVVGVPAVGGAAAVLGHLDGQDSLGLRQGGVLDENALHALDLEIADVPVGGRDPVEDEGEARQVAVGASVEALDVLQRAADLGRELCGRTVAGTG